MNSNFPDKQKKPNLFIISNYANTIPQKLHETVGLDLSRFKSILSYRFETEIYDLDIFSNALLKNEIDVSGVYLFFTSSQIQIYKSAITDIIYEVVLRGGLIVPDIIFYLAHENKYLQELHKSRCAISSPKSKLFTNAWNDFGVDFNYPVVVKSYDGFGSAGVLKVDNANKLRAGAEKLFRHYITLNRVGNLIRSAVKYFIKFRGLYPSRFGKVVVQELIPDLSYDWKVLVFGNKVYALKRYVRRKDFRASGSGNFDYREIASEELIRFAMNVRIKLNAPFISLDIIEDRNNEFFLIEYQACHFGLATVMNAIQYYEIGETGEINVNLVVGKVDIEELFSDSICEHVFGMRVNHAERP